MSESKSNVSPSDNNLVPKKERLQQGTVLMQERK